MYQRGAKVHDVSKKGHQRTRGGSMSAVQIYLLPKIVSKNTLNATITMATTAKPANNSDQMFPCLARSGFTCSRTTDLTAVVSPAYCAETRIVSNFRMTRTVILFSVTKMVSFGVVMNDVSTVIRSVYTVSHFNTIFSMTIGSDFLNNPQDDNANNDVKIKTLRIFI